MSNNADVILTAPKVLRADGGVWSTIQPRSMTSSKEYFLRKLTSRFRKRNINYAAEYRQPTEITEFSGCCFACNLELMERIGYFDEHTFLYYEEPILSAKARREGLRMLYIPDTEVIHHHGASTKSVSTFAVGCQLDSQMYYLRRYLGASKYWLALVVWAKRILDKHKYHDEQLYKAETQVLRNILNDRQQEKR